MKTFKEIIIETERAKKAIGHFNISDAAALRAIVEAALEVKVPVIVGVSEGEREFLGTRQAAALIKSLRQEHEFSLFLNADHTHSFEKVKEAVEAGFDAVLFDGSNLPFEENVKRTKEVVDFVKSKNPAIVVEGELGHIGTSSRLLKEIPQGATIKEEDLTTSDEAAEFVKKTGVDLFAPAVGNLHGMFASGRNPALNIKRIQEIKNAVEIPLVLHGGSGVSDGDFKMAIRAGITIIHISTELRLAWRRGLEKSLKENPEEITPYKILQPAVASIKEIVARRLKLFSA